RGKKGATSPLATLWTWWESTCRNPTATGAGIEHDPFGHPAWHAGSPDPQDARPRAHARLGHQPAHAAVLEGRAGREPGVAVSRAPAPPPAVRDRQGLAH